MAGVAAALVAGVVAFVLFWPASVHPESLLPQTAFLDSHVWGLDHIDRMILGDVPFAPRTDRAGFPLLRRAPVLGWAPALMTLPFRGWVDPVAATLGVLLASPALAALAAVAWLRQLGLRAGFAALAALTWAFSAPLLANLAAGNVDKAQVWVYPAWLALARIAQTGSSRSRAAAVIGAGLVALAAAMTEPYLGLFLPLVSLPVLAVEVWGHANRRSAARWAAATFIATGLGLLPAAAWFAGQQDSVEPQVFWPSPPPLRGGVLSPDQLPYADPLAFVWHGAPADWTQPAHLVYLGFPLVLVAAWGLRRGAAGRRVPATLSLAALTVALGPVLVLGGGWFRVGGRVLLLPMAALEACGYPLVHGGAYYRAAPLVGLGAVALAFGGLNQHAQRGSAWGRRLAVLLAVLSTADALRVSGPWPRPAAALEGRDAAAFLAEAPRAGAVLMLPLAGDQATGGRKLLLAALAGRATSALPRHLPTRMVAQETPWLRRWTDAARSGRVAGDVLAEAGFAYVLLTPLGDDEAPSLSGEALESQLGAPIFVSGAYRVWEVRPATTTAPGPGPAAP